MPVSPSGFLVRFRPAGPWRPGPESGARDRVDRVYHSDSVYSAVCSAMAQLGSLEEWLRATAGDACSAVRFSSCFPFQARTLFVPPPRSLWPPAPSSKLRWTGARFVPLQLVEMLVAGRPVEEDRWRVDGLSGCLVASGKSGPGPYRAALRSSASVDRLGAGVSTHSTACLEFASDSGLWLAVAFSGDEALAAWGERIKAALRLLADTGFGGERSRGWGRAAMPEIAEGPLPDLILKKPAPDGEPVTETAYWLLSLFSPAGSDAVDWQRGNYSIVTRSGRVESPSGWGERKKPTRMVEEGSVLVAAQPPSGSARDVAPDGFAHPVYRAGFALAIPIPWRSSVRTGTPPGAPATLPAPVAAPAPAEPPAEHPAPVPPTTVEEPVVEEPVEPPPPAEEPVVEEPVEPPPPAEPPPVEDPAPTDAQEPPAPVAEPALTDSQEPPPPAPEPEADQ